MSLALTHFNPASSIESFITNAQKQLILSEEEEKSLAFKFSLNNDLQAAHQLVLSHLRLVISIARSYLGYGLPHADLIQEGNVGLMKAVKNFKPENGARLSAYATFWIKSAINEYVITNWRIVKIATTKAQRKLFFNLRTLKGELSSVSDKEAISIANELNVKKEDVFEMDARFSSPDMPFDLEEDSEVSSYNPLKYLAQSSKYEPDILLQDQQEDRSERITEYLKLLDGRTQDIIYSRWLNEEKESTLADLSAKYHISMERVRQIEKAGMEKIKQFILK